MQPADDGEPVVVWRVGDALLAAPLAVTIEVAPVSHDGTAATRLGTLQIQSAPGLPSPERPRRAVVIRAGDTTLALAADDVLGVRTFDPSRAAPTPAWIRTLPTDHLAGLIRIDDDAIAALLATDTLPAP